MTSARVFERIDEAARMGASGGPGALDAMLDPLPRVAVIGHPYLLHEMLSHNLVERLGEFGRVVTAEMVSRTDTDAAMDTLPEGRRMWHFESRLLGVCICLETTSWRNWSWSAPLNAARGPSSNRISMMRPSGMGFHSFS